MPTFVNKKFIFYLAILQVTVMQIGWYLYIPSLPHIAAGLQGATINLVQLTAAFYSLALASSQLFYGPLSDYYGRRPILLIGISIFVVGSLLATSAPSIKILLCARLLQGIGAGAAGTLVRAVPRDIFHNQELAKCGTFVSIALAIPPLLAPVLGAYLQHLFNWRANFIFMLVYSLVLLVISLIFFPETNQQRRQTPLTWRQVMHSYWHVICNKRFMAFLLIGGLIMVGENTYDIIAPFLLQVRLHISVVQYGWLSVYLAGGFLIGTFIAGQLRARFNSQQQINIGLLFTLLAGLIMLLFAYCHYLSVITIFVPMFIFMFGFGFVYPQSNMGSMVEITQYAGAAAALLSSLQQALTGTGSVMVSHLAVQTAIPLASILVVISIISYLLLVTCLQQR